MKKIAITTALLAAVLCAHAQDSPFALFGKLQYEEGVCTKYIEAEFLQADKNMGHADTKTLKKLLKQVPQTAITFSYKGTEHRMDLSSKVKLPPINEGDRMYLTVRFYDLIRLAENDSLPFALVEDVTLAAMHSSNGKNDDRSYVYTDNLNQDYISGALYTGYYDKQKKSSFKKTTFVDESGLKTDVQIYSKKAQDGFLYINKVVMDKVVALGCMNDPFKVDYHLNGHLIVEEDDVMKLVTLQRSQIEVQEVVYDKESGRMTAYIISK